MKQQVSHRLDTGLLTWATEYAESRKTSRAVIIEEALRQFRDLSRGGVPDLPMTPEVREAGQQVAKPAPRVPGVTTARSLLDRGVSREVSARQHRLNEAKARSAQGGES